MQVGEVTFISVKKFPITSMPTKNNPSFKRNSFNELQINLSCAVIFTFCTLPPTCIFDLISFILGTLRIAATGSPLTKIILLSPFLISGKNF